MTRLFFRPPHARAALASLTLFVALACGKTSDSGTQPPASCQASDICTEATDDVKVVRFTPSSIVVAVGEKRSVRIFTEPDVCSPVNIPVTVDAQNVATVDGSFTADPCTAEKTLSVTGVAPGTAKASATFGASTAALTINVLTKDPVTCSGGSPASSDVGPGGSVSAFGATLAVQAGAALDPPDPGTPPSVWGARNDPLDIPSHVDPFTATIDCAAGTAPDGMIALGPAITFGPSDKHVLRDLVMEIPVNPALMPPNAKLRHLRVQFSSATLKTPRFVAVANARFEPRDAGKWVLRFEAPRLGTYQAFVATDAGAQKRTRHLVHRAVFGFSMGGIGASMFGMNHHDLFDVVAPLGGPLDATFFLWYFQHYHFGGFCPRKAGDPVPTTPCHADVGVPDQIYEHVQDYEHWWHHDGVDGTGGTFPRNEYVEIFRDVSAMWGDPSGENKTFPSVASGITDPLPFAPGQTADYCGDATKATIAKTGYYDSQFNPDGSLPVIKYCDGMHSAAGPDVWAPGGKEPVEVAVSVDYNGNGARDEGEPVITQAQEPFDDTGTDGAFDKDEPGYDASANLDPNGDDYDFQYNPTGTENNHHHEDAEHFDDFGVDGVKCPTAGTCAFDYGEGDGKFTQTDGLATFQNRDGRAQMLGWAPAPPGGEWSDAALDQLDFYSDGGIRDIFNWGMIGDHYSGAWAARKRPLLYFNDSLYLPNVTITDETKFDPKVVDWTALPSATYMRYGNIDASRRDIDKGDGQHVGSADQVIRRIINAIYYIGSRWPDADTSYAEDPSEFDDPDPCGGNRLTCTFDFKANDGRVGPTTIILPPGYWSEASKNANVRYPVTYFLHGYGQQPSDLQALVLFLSPLMGQGLSSKSTRLPKMIMVFVDGRCRDEAGGRECVNGQFYVNSVRKDGPQIDNYFQDLIKFVDGKYRTMAPADVQIDD